MIDRVTLMIDEPRIKFRRKRALTVSSTHHFLSPDHVTLLDLWHLAYDDSDAV